MTGGFEMGCVSPCKACEFVGAFCRKKGEWDLLREEKEEVGRGPEACKIEYSPELRSKFLMHIFTFLFTVKVQYLGLIWGFKIRDEIQVARKRPCMQAG